MNDHSVLIIEDDDALLLGLTDNFTSSGFRVLTRDNIMDSVWGDAVIVTSRSVDRCVARLRRKIEPDPSRPTYIQTIRDVGYRFEIE